MCNNIVVNQHGTFMSIIKFQKLTLFVGACSGAAGTAGVDDAPSFILSI